MKRIHRDGDFTMTERPSNIKITDRLSNGQYLHLWFWRNRNRHRSEECPIDYVWVVGVYIGDKKGAALWRRKSHPSRQTGECGIEGLRVALGFIMALCRQLSYREELQVAWEDDKRGRAYRWLLRYPGFTEYKEDKKLAYRNPVYWTLDESEVAE